MAGEFVEAPAAERGVVEALGLEHDECAAHLHGVTRGHDGGVEGHVHKLALDEDEVLHGPRDAVGVPASGLIVGTDFAPAVDGDEACLSGMIQMAADGLRAHASHAGQSLLGGVRGVFFAVGVEHQLGQRHQLVHPKVLGCRAGKGNVHRINNLVRG